MATREINEKYCKACNRYYEDEYMFCPICGKSLESDDINVSELKEGFRSVYGLWEVSTYGNFEGSTIQELGTYEGYIDDIALALEDKAVITLKFKPAKPKEKIKPKKNSRRVRVCFPFEVYDGKKETDEFNEIVQKLFHYRDSVKVKAINAYSFSIEKNKKK